MSGLNKERSSETLKQEALQAAAYQMERDRKEQKEKTQNQEDRKVLSDFLHCIAYGEQEKEEAMLKECSALALHKGNLRDPSEREFKGITGFQYAVWGLDWHMWRMLLKYMDKETAILQLSELEEKETAHGKYFSLEPLVGALNTFVESFDRWVPREREYHWCRVVGRLQLLLPVSVVNEYCHPSRSFEPLPSFKEESLLRSVNLFGSQGAWYTAIYTDTALGVYNGKLGEKCGACRYSPVAARALVFPDKAYVKTDVEAIQHLWAVRQQQIEELRTALRACLILEEHLPKPIMSLILSYLR